MSKCKYFDNIRKLEVWEKIPTENCGSCEEWNVDRQKCNCWQMVLDAYAESREFRVYDRQMRGNKGINL